METGGGERIRILLADDHDIVREGLRSLLEREPDMDVVADVADGRSAIRVTRELRPDVVIMDIGMPDLNGIDATRQIVADLGTAKVLCLSVHREKGLVTAMLQAGARGYLIKTHATKELVEAVRSVAEGNTFVSPQVAGALVDHLVQAGGPGAEAGARPQLSTREREVLQLIAEGHHTKEIASRLHISPKTVLAHRESLMRKLGVDSVVALAKFALREGISQL